MKINKRMRKYYLTSGVHEITLTFTLITGKSQIDKLYEMSSKSEIIFTRNMRHLHK